MAKAKINKQDVSSSLGPLLLKLRCKRGLSMQSLASQTGISAAYICRIEAGDRKPSRDLLESLANVLIPIANQAEKDELLLSAGFAPANIKNFMGRQELISIYQEALVKDANDFKAYIGFVMCLIRSGEHESARKQIHNGMQQFDDMVQLQALLAALELSKKNYKQAVLFQHEALKQYRGNEDHSNSNLRLIDLLLSLGVMYFEQANAFAYQRALALTEKRFEDSQNLAELALTHLHKAQTAFEEALQVSPDEIYILDELARVHFTIAYLLPSKAAEANWKASIQAFEKAIHSRNKQDLGYKALLQSTAFLALAYSKVGDFEKAWFTLNIIEACLPHFWLVHYIKACYFGLRIQAEYQGQYHKQSQSLFAEALAALEEAVMTIDMDNRAQKEALLEPDLEPIRQFCSKQFQSIVQVAKKYV